jgi:hypothetical protein
MNSSDRVYQDRDEIIGMSTTLELASFEDHVAMALSLKRYFSTVGLEILLAETVSNMDF